MKQHVLSEPLSRPKANVVKILMRLFYFFGRVPKLKNKTTSAIRARTYFMAAMSKGSVISSKAKEHLNTTQVESI